jgi:glycosyltransferase involved in cell wall biosynthesis
VSSKRDQGRSVWIFNHYAVGPGVPGGTRHYDIGRELAKRGWQVTVFSAVYPRREPPVRGQSVETGRDSGPTRVHDGVSFIRVPTLHGRKANAMRVLTMLSYVPGATRVIKGLAPPDVIVGSSVHPFAAWIAWRLARRIGCRYLFEIRDLWPETIIELGGVSRHHPFVMLLSRIERVLVQSADRVVTLLPNAYSYLARFGIPEHKVVVVPNGTDVSRLDHIDGELPSCIDMELNRMKGAFIVAYAGAHGLANRLDTVIDAAVICSATGETGVEFLLVGDGPDKPRLQKRVSQLQLRNVTFADRISKESVLPLLTRCDAGVIAWTKTPLYQYGISPNKLFDYMIAGLPIVMAGDSPNNPLSSSDGGVVVPYDDADAMAKALMDLAADRDKAHAMGLKGRQYLIKNHSSAHLACLMEKALLGALSEAEA